MVRAVRTFMFFRGRPPARSDWLGCSDPNWPTMTDILALFGSLDALLRACGADPCRADSG